MTPEQDIDAARRARREIRESLTEIRTLRADIGNRVRAAYELGFTKTEIGRLSGLARSTVYSILEHPDAVFAARVRMDLADAAAAVEPDPAALAKIQAKTRPGQTSPPTGP